MVTASSLFRSGICSRSWKLFKRKGSPGESRGCFSKRCEESCKHKLVLTSHLPCVMLGAFIYLSASEGGRKKLAAFVPESCV